MGIKQYVGISRDHSASMSGIVKAAMNDYNSLIGDIKAAAAAENIDTIVSTVLNGIGPGNGKVRRDVVNSSVHRLEPLRTYPANGNSTPLWDSVGELIEIFESVPNYHDLDVSFMVMVVTDGGENSSTKWSTSKLAEKIRELQKSDRWTFVFRVPRGQRQSLIRNLGVYDDNVIEWDAGSSKDLERTTVVNSAATRSYFTARASGAKSTTSFYANMAAVPIAEVKATLTEIKDPSLEFLYISRDMDITTAIEKQWGRRLHRGSAFYQLTKTEEVQDHKLIAVRDKSTRKTYSGAAARQLLGLPDYGTIKLHPGNNGNYDVFIQSTSVNRKLIGGTEVMYWPAASR